MVIQSKKVELGSGRMACVDGEMKLVRAWGV